MLIQPAAPVAPSRPAGDSKRLRRLFTVAGFAFLAVVGSALPAAAQIYSWRDANGNLVLSNTQRPPDGSPSRTYDVAHGRGLRATTYVPPARSDSYDELIVEHARLHGVRAELIRAVVQVESAYNARATSPKGAMGLMQLMPETARQFGVVNPYNPTENVRAGVAYLRQLLDRYDENEELALAAYNAGPGAVDKYGETVPPYRETRNYVTKINRIAGAGATPVVRSNVGTGGSGGTHVPVGLDARPVSASKIYQVIRIIDGREVVVFTDKRPD